MVGLLFKWVKFLGLWKDLCIVVILLNVIICLFLILIGSFSIFFSDLNMEGILIEKWL